MATCSTGATLTRESVCASSARETVPSVNSSPRRKGSRPTMSRSARYGDLACWRRKCAWTRPPATVGSAVVTRPPEVAVDIPAAYRHSYEILNLRERRVAGLGFDGTRQRRADRGEPYITRLPITKGDRKLWEYSTASRRSSQARPAASGAASGD